MRADDRAEVDDAPAVAPEPLDRLLRGENRPENVDGVVEVKALFGDLREGAEAEYPALLTKTSSLPNAESTSLNNRATSAALDTSAPTAIASPPLAVIA